MVKGGFMVKGDMHSEGGHVWQKRGMCGKGACIREGTCMARRHAWWGDACVAGEGQGRGRKDSHYSGRYASYWNAFLWFFFTCILSRFMKSNFIGRYLVFTDNNLKHAPRSILRIFYFET